MVKIVESLESETGYATPVYVLGLFYMYTCTTKECVL